MAFHHIFPQVYFIYKQPNHAQVKQSLLADYDPADSERDRQWNCNSTRIQADPNKILPVMTPVLREFGNEIQRAAKVFVLSCWVNFYRQGSFQELHNHVGAGCQMALVYFINYESRQDGRFYFYDTNTDVVSADLPDLLNGPAGAFGSVLYPPVEEGDVLLFPSYLHHGVGPHSSENLRITLSCNLRFQLR